MISGDRATTSKGFGGLWILAAVRPVAPLKNAAPHRHWSRSLALAGLALLLVVNLGVNLPHRLAQAKGFYGIGHDHYAQSNRREIHMRWYSSRLNAGWSTVRYWPNGPAADGRHFVPTEHEPSAGRGRNGLLSGACSLLSGERRTGTPGKVVRALVRQFTAVRSQPTISPAERSAPSSCITPVLGLYWQDAQKRGGLGTAVVRTPGALDPAPKVVVADSGCHTGGYGIQLSGPHGNSHRSIVPRHRDGRQRHREPQPQRQRVLADPTASHHLRGHRQRDPVRNGAMASWASPGCRNTRARVVPSTQLVELTVTDTDPQRPSEMANELANQLILISPARRAVTISAAPGVHHAATQRPGSQHPGDAGRDQPQAGQPGQHVQRPPDRRHAGPDRGLGEQAHLPAIQLCPRCWPTPSAAR